MSNARLCLGRWGEQVAYNHLRAAGYRLVDRNYRCSYGEIDLVAVQDQTWVFVEVKTRRGDAFGRPEEAINSRKAERLIQVARHYLQANALEGVDWRVDVVAVELDAKGKLLRVEQIENAVSGW